MGCVTELQTWRPSWRRPLAWSCQRAAGRLRFTILVAPRSSTAIVARRPHRVIVRADHRQFGRTLPTSRLFGGPTIAVSPIEYALSRCGVDGRQGLCRSQFHTPHKLLLLFACTIERSRFLRHRPTFFRPAWPSLRLRTSFGWRANPAPSPPTSWRGGARVMTGRATARGIWRRCAWPHQSPMP